VVRGGGGGGGWGAGWGGGVGWGGGGGVGGGGGGGVAFPGPMLTVLFSTARLFRARAVLQQRFLHSGISFW